MQNGAAGREVAFSMPSTRPALLPGNVPSYSRFYLENPGGQGGR
jgi:hypothetical protein